MNTYKQLFHLGWTALMLCLAACHDSSLTSDDPIPFRVHIGTIPLQGVEVPFDSPSRAYNPMTPDKENMIKSLCVFQFDTEGNLRKLDGDNRYLYQDFYDVTHPNGISSVTDKDMPSLKELASDKATRTCIIANIDEVTLRSYLFPRGTDDPVNLSEFLDIQFRLPFVTPADIKEDESKELGHVNDIYMFGDYEGIVPKEGFTVGLGRIVTRLEIYLTHEEGSEFKPTDKFYAAVDHMESSAYFSPAKNSPHNHYADDKPYPLNEHHISQQTGGGIVYLYAGPHVGPINDPTRLRVWCVDTELTGDYEPTLDDPSGEVILGDDPQNKNYQLNRNTIYRFEVKFTRKP